MNDLFKNKIYNPCIFINNNDEYQIGSNIILKKKIGSDSKNANVFLSYFKSNPEIIFASKLTPLNNNTIKDLKIQEKIMKTINIHKCPHFPILYNSYICKYKNNIYKDNLYKYPFVIKHAILNKKDILITLNKLADGDLRMLLINSSLTDKEILNILLQVYISLIYYYKYIGLFHYDTKLDNFLYYRIKKGGYFHYKILEKDYYLENIGILCVIWDFEVSKEFGEDNIERDFKDVIRGFLPKKKIKKGEKKIGYNKNIQTIKIIEDIYIYLFSNKYSNDINELPILIKKIINIFINYKILLE